MPLNKKPLSRRHFVRLTGLLLVGGGLLPRVAVAMTNQQAQDLIIKVVNDVLAIINSGKPESEMLKDFESIFINYADVPTIARYCLGAPWRTASSGERSAYSKAFQGYVARKYGRQFRKFEGATIAIKRVREAGNLGILVKTSVKLQGRDPFAVEWNVSDRSGKDKFINLIIEGISLLSTERTEIGSMLEAVQGDMNHLISNLNAA